MAENSFDLSPEVQSQLRETFLEESSTLVDQLESSLLHLEHTPGDEDSLKEAFRAAHTLKGSAAGVGFKEVAAFTHELENALDGLRSHLFALVPAGVSALLLCVDLLRGLLAAARGDAAPPDTEDSLARLRAAFPRLHKEGITASSTPEVPKQIVNWGSACLIDLSAGELASLGDELLARADVYVVRFTLPEDAFARGLEPTALLRALEGEARPIRVIPLVETIPPLADLDPTNCYLGFDCVVTTHSSEADIQAVFEFCPEGAVIQVSRIDRRRLADLAAAHNGKNGEKHPASQSWKMLGDILVEDGLIRPEDLEKALAKQQEAGSGPANADGRTIRVKQERLDGFMDLVGELVTARNTLLHLHRMVETEYQLPELARRMKETSTIVNRTVSQLQSGVLSLRMVPLGTVFQRLPRAVRDVAARQEKQVVFQVNGEDTEVDKTVADALVDPLMHLVRNSVDHGIESPRTRLEDGKSEEGQVRISANRDGNTVVIEIQDDGAGIDPERIRQAAVTKGLLSPAAAAGLSETEAMDLIFAAGLSTASVVSDISGRGVGMDVVRSNVARMGGNVSVVSRLGRGTTIRLQLPLTLSVFRALILRAAGETFALPLEAVREITSIQPERAQTMYGRPVVSLRGELVGLVSLAAAMGMAQESVTQAEAGEEGLPVVVVVAGGERVGLLVDALGQPQEIMSKPLEGYLAAGGAVAGASVMGDGRVALVLDPSGLVRMALAHARGEGDSLSLIAAGGAR